MSVAPATPPTGAIQPASISLEQKPKSQQLFGDMWSKHALGLNRQKSAVWRSAFKEQKLFSIVFKLNFHRILFTWQEVTEKERFAP